MRLILLSLILALISNYENAASPISSSADNIKDEGATKNDTNSGSDRNQPQERMLHFNPNFEDELAGMQELDSGESGITDPSLDEVEPFAHAPPLVTSTPTSHVTLDHDAAGTLEKPEAKMSPVKVKFSKNPERFPLQHFQKPLPSPAASDELHEDKSPGANSASSKVGGNRPVMENRQEVYTNNSSRSRYPLQTTSSAPSSVASHPLQRSDSAETENNFSRDKNKSQDCKETQFPGTTPDEDDKVQKASRLNATALLRASSTPGILKQKPLQELSRPPSVKPAFKGLSSRQPNDWSPQKFQEAQILPALVGVFLASILTVAAAWMSLGESSNYGNFEQRLLGRQSLPSMPKASFKRPTFPASRTVQRPPLWNRPSPYLEPWF